LPLYVGPVSSNIAGQNAIKRALVLSWELPFVNLGHDDFIVLGIEQPALH
jgi:hypothetical protein